MEVSFLFELMIWISWFLAFAVLILGSISICMVLLFQFPSLFFLILWFSISIQLCKYHLNVIFCWSWILAFFCSSSFICSMCWFIMFMRFRCVSICRPCSKLEWLISLDEFDFSSMRSSVLLVSEFDHEAYGLRGMCIITRQRFQVAI